MYISKYKLLWSSSVVFILVNIVENFIHFAIGRSVETKGDLNVRFKWPTKVDVSKIILVMIIFAFINSGLLYLVEKWLS
jgi:hypothetical protein